MKLFVEFSTHEEYRELALLGMFQEMMDTGGSVDINVLPWWFITLSHTVANWPSQIDWVDSCRDEGWHRPSNIGERNLRITSVGFIVGKEHDSITISSGIAWPDSEDPQTSTTHTIPLCAVTRIRKLGAVIEDPGPTGKRRKR